MTTTFIKIMSDFISYIIQHHPKLLDGLAGSNIKADLNDAISSGHYQCSNCHVNHQLHFVSLLRVEWCGIQVCCSGELLKITLV